MRALLLVVLLLAPLAPAVSVAAVLTDYGAVGDGVADTTPAFDAAVQAVCASPTERTLRVPVGRFLFLSAPQRIPCALNVVGEGPGVTHLVRGFSGTSSPGFLIWAGGQDQYGGGSLRDLLLDAGTTSGGIALWVHAHLETDPTVPSRNPHGLLVENVLISSMAVDATSGWAYGVYLDGGDNSAPPAGVAPGIRWVRLHNVSVSKASILAYLFYYANGTRASLVDCWIPRGPNGVTVQGLHSAGTYVVAPSCTLVTP